MTYTTVTRTAALQESRALRGYARYGVPVPRCAPIDMWDEWQRQTHTNTTSFGAPRVAA